MPKFYNHNSMSQFNDTFLKACRKESVTHTPVWFMRQAGRYQKEYLAIKEKYSMIEICQNPELITQVTLLPIKQFNLDAAIVFSDILIPLGPMGIDFWYKGGVGPVINNPIRSVKDIDNLKPISASEHLHYTGKALQMLTKELSVPCIGFAGAPFTLASYMIEGGPSKSYIELKKMMYNQTNAWNKLMNTLAESMAEYLVFQAESGASALQIFDSWVGILSEEDYLEYVHPHMLKMVHSIKEKCPVPIIVFGTNTSHLLHHFKATGADVIGIDWKTNLISAWKDLDFEVAVQGNLDPTLLFADWKVIEKHATKLLESVKGKNGFIFNLGHGILPGTPVENVSKLADFVRNYN